MFKNTSHLLALIFCCACPGLSMAAAETGVAKTLLDQRVTFLGDSISQAGEYITLIEYYLTKHYPKNRIDIIGVGLSSETTSGLTEKVHPGPRPCIHTRLARILTQEQPKVVIACYGMNDGIYLPLDHVRTTAFRDGEIKLIRDVQASGAEMILMTPPVFDPLPDGDNVSWDDTGPGYTKPYAKYDEVLASYSAWIMSLQMNKLITVDLHTPMATYLAKQRLTDARYVLSGDGIHPGELGHLLMAQAFLGRVGIAQPDENPQTTLDAILCDPLYPLVKKHREMRSQAWLAYSRGGDKAPVDAMELELQPLIGQIDALRRK